jgi:hypothetical protein
MNKIFLVVIFVLAGCNDTIKNFSSDEYPEWAVIEFKHAYAKSGEWAFCAEQLYLDCFPIDTEECVYVLSKFRDTCFEHTEKVAPTIKFLADVRQYSIEFGSCMNHLHAKVYEEKTEKIEACVSKSQLDADRMANSLLNHYKAHNPTVLPPQGQ